MLFQRDHQTFLPVDDHGFHQVGAVWLDLNHDIGGFDFEFSGIDHIGGEEGSIFSGGFLKAFVQSFQMLLISAAVG